MSTAGIVRQSETNLGDILWAVEDAIDAGGFSAEQLDGLQAELERCRAGLQSQLDGLTGAKRPANKPAPAARNGKAKPKQPCRR